MANGKLVSGVVAAAILLGCGVAAIKLHRAPAKEADEDEKPAAAAPIPVHAASVQLGSLTSILHATGTLQPLPNGKSRVAAQVSGRLLTVRVRPGQAVRAGEILATVSRPDLQATARQAGAGTREAEREVDALRAERDTKAHAVPLQEQRAQADLDAARAKLALVKAGSRPEEIERAAAALQSAQADLARLQAGARPQEVAQAEAAVRDARASRDALQKEATRKRSLLASGIVAARDVERAEADLVTAQANLETKTLALALVKAGSRPEELRAQEGKVREAEAQLRQARAGARPEEVREAQAGVEAAQTELAQARAAREELRALDERIRAASARAEAAREQSRAATTTAGRSEIRSPLNGVVTQVMASAGEGVAEQTPVVEILNRDAFRAALDVPAAAARSVAPGMPVVLTVPSVPGFRYAGNIRGLLASASPDTGLLTAEVWVNDPQHRLAEGMPVNAQLSVRREDHRIFVPTSAIFTREGETSVYVIGPAPATEEKDDEKKPGGTSEQDDTGRKDAKPGGKPGPEADASALAVNARTVEIGADRGGETEIVKGLRPGERVVTDGSLSLADGTRVTVAP